MKNHPITDKYYIKEIYSDDSHLEEKTELNDIIHEYHKEAVKKYRLMSGGQGRLCSLEECLDIPDERTVEERIESILKGIAAQSGLVPQAKNELMKLIDELNR